MTAIAHIGQADLLRRGVQIWLGDESASGITQISYGAPVLNYVAHDDDGLSPAPSLSLREDQARALLGAMIRHFDGGEDTRSLRRDYDAERKRVDLLIDKLVARPIIVGGDTL